ncbi:MAG TPA: efflux RND transporter periplasmic adaptor subunit [Gemmatimonadaceae bacterium]
MTTSLEPTTSGSPPSVPPPGGPRDPEDHAQRPRHSRRRLIVGAGVIVVLLVSLLAAGVAPRIARGKRLNAAVAVATAALPVVSVTRVVTAPSNPTVILPGTLQPMLTTAIYARTPGYLNRILVDIGSRVSAGSLLAVIDAPDLDQQVVQARGIVGQARAALQLASVELERWRALSAGGAVTADELDQKVAAFNMATATLRAAEADLARLIHLQAFERVVAPFTGVITQRNVDPGALVGTAGSASTALLAGSGSAVGSLFQIARVDSLRVYVQVPEEYSMDLRIGTPAVVTMPQLPGDTLAGRVTKTSRSLDAATRTLLTEVDVANRTGTYIPGMYAQAQMRIAQGAAPIQLPATGLVIRAGPPQVMILQPDSTVRFQNIQIGRDHGPWLEVTGGLAAGSTILINPPDNLQNGARVRAISADTAVANRGRASGVVPSTH